jgi:hypothetical protein
MEIATVATSTTINSISIKPLDHLQKEQLCIIFKIILIKKKYLTINLIY